MRRIIANEQSHYFLICWREGILVILCIVNGDQISRAGVGCFLAFVWFGDLFFFI